MELHPLSLRDTVSLTHTTHTHTDNRPVSLVVSLTVPLLCSYDDYDYGSVNVLLERSLKVFVKTMACHPEQTTVRIYHAFWRHFRHSEKVQTSLIPIRYENHLTF